MTTAPAIAARVIPTDVPLTEAETDAVLEIAYLAIAADHTLADAELDAFRQIMQKLASLPHRGDAYRAGAGKDAAPVSDRKLNDMLDKMNARVERKDVDEHLRTLAKGLSAEARGIAYKVAHAISLADMDSSDEEFEFDLQLIDALELSTDTAESLVSDVMSAMYEPEEPHG